MTELQEALASTLKQRGYDLGNAAVVDIIKHLIADALPERVVGQTDEETLGKELAFVHEYCSDNRDHASSHSHRA